MRTKKNLFILVSSKENPWISFKVSVNIKVAQYTIEGNILFIILFSYGENPKIV